jgi:hypothetical protein
MQDLDAKWHAKKAWEAIWGTIVLAIAAAVWALFKQSGASMGLALSAAAIVLGFSVLAVAVLRELQKSRRLREAQVPMKELSIQKDGNSCQGNGVKNQAFMIATPDDEIPVSAIGMLREISFQYFEHGTDAMFRVRCAVDFYGPRKTDPSPFLLRLSAPGVSGEIARMHVQTGIVPRCPCQLVYNGEGRWSHLAEAAHRTMTRKPGAQGPAPWETIPPGDTLYCNLELHLPDGHDWKVHCE